MMLNTNVHAESFSTAAINQPDLKILDFVFSDGKAPDWYIPPTKTLPLIPGFNERYEEVKKCISDGSITHEGLGALRSLSEQFFQTWDISSIQLIAECGASRSMEMLEFFATYREMIWDYDCFCYWERLPDQIEIFRGGEGTPEELARGFSWSDRQDFAEPFANRSANGIVLKAKVSKNDILLVETSVGTIVPRIGSISNIVQTK